VKRPGIVHRLDKDTSGLLVVAKNDRAHRSLAGQFADHGRTGDMTRGYLAFVWGSPLRPKGTIDAPIDRHPRSRNKMAVREGGRSARTSYEVRAEYASPAVSFLECALETGRTHQIRVHLQAIGHPVVGDASYGGARRALDPGRPFLHATSVSFVHPIRGTPVTVTEPLPDDLESVLARLA